MRPLLPDITRSYILKHISQEEIFSHYTGVSVSTITDCVNSKNLIKSPIRKDTDPTVGFYYTNTGRLRMRDFAGYFWGDCFDVVAYRLSVDATSSQGFAIILEHIAKEFKLHKFSDSYQIPVNYDSEYQSVEKLKKDTIIDIQLRNWLAIDAKVWKYLTRVDLEAAMIFPCMYIWINKQLIYRFQGNDPAYAYCFGDGKYKIYFPHRKQYRFLSNTSVVQGIHLIEPSRFGIITKSYKDVIYLRKFNINAVAPSGESVLLPANQIQFIKTMYDYTFSLMDYDNTGIHLAWRMRKVYGIEPMFLRTKVWARKQGYRGAKDFSDFVQLNGIKETEKLILQTVDYYNRNYNLDFEWKRLS